MPIVFGQVGAPSTTSAADASNLPALQGKQGDMIVSELHGKYYTQTYRGNVFGFLRAAVTLPVNAATLASVYSIYNPPGSGKNLEMLCFDMAYVLATTVVDGVGLYYSTAASGAAGSTFTTNVTPISKLLGGPSSSPVALCYSALTAVGTPVLADILAYTGAVTSTAANPIHYDFDGRTVVSPGTLIHLAMTTAASTASGFTGGLTWAEVPI